jgi:hypothetical protein
VWRSGAGSPRKRRQRKPPRLLGRRAACAGPPLHHATSSRRPCWPRGTGPAGNCRCRLRSRRSPRARAPGWWPNRKIIGAWHVIINAKQRNYNCIRGRTNASYSGHVKLCREKREGGACLFVRFNSSSLAVNTRYALARQPLRRYKQVWGPLTSSVQ